MNAFEKQDRYRVISPLGAGSEASVWLADEVGTDKQVALKYFSSQPGVSAFRELNNAMQRAHPNIVPLLDFTYLPDGDSFLVFEYIAGGSLREWLDQNNQCGLTEALEIIHDVLSALAQLHADGAIHCDIKPENILRDVDETTGRAVYKLTDFGVTRQTNQSVANSEFVGSPAYMSPERFRDALYPCSDLYSVGIILYELLTGDRPFLGTAEEVAKAHLGKPIPDIPNLDSDTQGFLHNLLEKDPRKRVQTGEIALRTLDVLRGRDSQDSRNPPLRTLRVTSVPPISFEKEITSRIRGRFSLAPTSTAPRLIESRNRLQLAVDFGPHWEFFDGISGRFNNQILSKSGDPYQIVAPDGIVHAVQQKVRLWQAGSNKSVDLATFCPRVNTFALSPDHQKLAWGSEKSFEIIMTENEERIPIQHDSLHSKPILTWISSELLVATSGPMHPHLKVIDLTGKTVAQIDLPGPILQTSQFSTAPLWVCLDHEHHDSLFVVTVEADSSWHQWRIPKDHRLIDFCRDGLVSLDGAGIVSLWNRRHQGKSLIKLASEVDGIVFSPTNRFGITWRDTPKRKEITVLEFVSRS